MEYKKQNNAELLTYRVIGVFTWTFGDKEINRQKRKRR